MIKQLLPVTICLTLVACRGGETEEGASELIDSLPKQILQMEDLTAFQEAGSNWQIAGDVWSDYRTEQDMELMEGTGVLVNLPDGSGITGVSNESGGSNGAGASNASGGSNLTTDLEHGDIEMKVEFLVPRGSNSGIYFQGRYELQILDSWEGEGVGGTESAIGSEATQEGEPALQTGDTEIGNTAFDETRFSDVGGIYERWDDTMPEGEQGFEGHAPLVNAALAPGLWQEFHVLFRAPRFDENGAKTRNARFDFVRLNGHLIHEGVELTGPTRGAVSEEEVSHAPLMIQGDHGPVAFRNLRYKRYEESDSLTLGPLSYTVYDYEGVRLPDFDTLSVVLAEGETESFNVSELSPKNEYYAIRFTGELDVPVSGDYLFQTQISNGGDLSIDGDLIIASDGEFEYRRLGNIIHLEEGTHPLEMTYFQRTWGTQLLLFYEGPRMESRTLASPQPEENFSVNNPIIVNPAPGEPKLIGGFTNQGTEKRTHTLSVGTAEGVHYSYDLYHSSLLKFWRGPFADVTRMWRNRGEEQLLVPLNAAVETEAGVPIATMGGGSVRLYENVPELLSGQEYMLDEDGLPTFLSVLDGVQMSDRISPSDETEGLVREIQFQSVETGAEPGDDLVGLLAVGEQIELLSNGLYRINGNHYIRLLEAGGQEPAIEDAGDRSALVVPVLRNAARSEIAYELIW